MPDPLPASPIDDVALFPPRHAAEELTATRLQRRGVEGASAVTRLPSGVAPTLGHLGVLADVAAGQSLSPALPPGQDVRTISMHLQLLHPLPEAALVFGEGRPRHLDADTGLATAEMTLADGTVVALSTVRFMRVEATTHVPDPERRFPLGGLAIQSDWDAALGLGDSKQGATGAVGDPTAEDDGVLVVRPHERTRNAAGVLHGGLHVRVLELACRRTAGLPAQNGPFRLADLDVTYHRPLLVDGTTDHRLHGRLIRAGRRIIVAEARLEDPRGRLLTQAHASYTHSSS